MMTVSAAVSVMPCPPALVDSRKMKLSASPAQTDTSYDSQSSPATAGGPLALLVDCTKSDAVDWLCKPLDNNSHALLLHHDMH